LLSISTFAEVKPDWSIVANMCGDNTSPTMTINAPLRACFASVTGHQDLEVVFFEYENEKKYFLVTEKDMRIGANTLTLEEITVSEGGRYIFLGDFKKNGEILEVTTTFGFAGMIMKGGDFDGTMQPVYTTQNVLF
jgi:hypothetical protein